MLSIGVSDFLNFFKKYDLVPISLEINADLETTVSIFLKLEASFLLESVEKGDSLGRYSFIGLGKKEEIIVNDREVTINHYSKNKKIKEEKFIPKNILDFFKKKLLERKVKSSENLPPFFGGYLGYLGYETITWFEPKVAIHQWEKIDLPDSILIRSEVIIAYDNVKKVANLIYTAGKSEATKEDYKKIISYLEKLKNKINSPLLYKPTPLNPKELSKSNFNFFPKKAFMDKVKKAVDYIKKGEIIQVVLSNRFTIKSTLDPFSVYRTLKNLNPSPYLFYLKFDDFTLMGSSPEVMVKVSQGEMLLRPLAGTRKRGKTTHQDTLLKEELLNDEKEIAEHIMLVDLGRNDLSRVAKTGSVEVEDYMQVDKYSQVQHIVSTVKAFLSKGKDALDVLRATFPAGTLSGAPKIRAMEVIHELEGRRRNFYGGAVLTLGFNGDLNSCITIRSILFRDNQAIIQSGAGIVLDSNPENEYKECKSKAQALMDAIRLTYERLKNDINN